jgi:biotin operon repressor
MGEPASALGISAPAITKHIERLEEKGAYVNL